MRSFRRKEWIWLAVLAVLGAGCRGSVSPESPAGAVVRITAPSDGAQVQAPFVVEFEISGVEIGPTDTGRHHVHVYVDDRYDVHESADPYTVSGMSAGEHTIRVILAKANHDETDVADEVRLTAAAGGGGVESSPPAGGYYGGY